jgi:hypothetical protein
MSEREKAEVRELVCWWLAQTWFDLRDEKRYPYTKRAIRLVKAAESQASATT